MGATRNTGYLENLIQYDASDNVAIATTVNPSYKVTLGGSLLGTSAVFSSSIQATSATFTGNVTVNSTNAKTAGTAWNLNVRDTTSMAANVGGGISFQGLYTTGGAVGNFGAIAAYKTNATSGNESGGLRFYYSANGVITQGLQISETGAATFSSSVSVVGLTSTGNIQTSASNIVLGLGNTANAESIIFSYNSNAASRSWRILKDWTAFGDFQIQQSTTQTGSSYDPKFVINPSGNVGIGTTSPGEKLHISNSAVIRMDGGTGVTPFAIANNNSTGFRIYDYTAALDRMVITSGGDVGIGTTSPSSYAAGKLAIVGSTTSNFGIAIDNTYTAGLSGTSSVFLYNNGSLKVRYDYSRGDDAGIIGTVASIPMWFFTGNAERMRITSGGYSKHSNNGTYRGSTDSYHEFVQTANDRNTIFRSTNASYTSNILLLDAVRSANSAYSFLFANSGDNTDREFDLQGDGNGKCDGSWTGGGADYAEYFEWADGNINNEDRRGMSVSLIENKIKIAEQGESVIGVISGNPSIVGDAAWNKWNGKYLRDEFNSYILDAEGYRTPNPNYDETMEYIPREKRPEWSAVGLVGKLRVRKGQATMPSWVKMRDISDTVEEWLVK